MKITLISTSTFPADQGLRTLSSCLKREGHNVKMIFLPLGEDYFRKYTKDEIRQVEEQAKDSGLIGISAMESTSGRAQQLIDLFEKRGVPVVWGGPHPTFFPQRCFERCNIIAVGEAEKAILELASKLEKNEDITQIKNLWVRKDGKEYINPVGSPVHNLDELAHPDYDLEDQVILEKGKLIPFEERHIGGMIFFQTERGCPQACSYCTNNIMRELYKGKGDLLRTHSVDYVIKELKRLKNKFPSIGVFDLRDETFTIRDINWIREFAKRYKEEVGIRFKCLAEPATMSAENVSSEKIDLLVDAGLTDIIIGIQSGSDRLNKNVYNRFISADQVLRCAKVLNKHKHKLAVMYDVISSNPYETAEDILETIKLLRKLPKPYYLSVNNLIFFEGTPLFKKALEDGYIKTYNDTASMLNYWDRWEHIKLKKKNAYLNLVLNLMRGPCTNTRYGLLPAFVVDNLIKKGIVDFNIKHESPTYLAGEMVSVMDNMREKIAKPVYRSMPVNFKNWYDKVRYRA
ncbi:B12-binding domain-containing radical SAM protein [Candidatus Woesearchaeota archaeon]|nr:B12-binding domain-containing radical SAM protein [Candidatus Woesearchaeota archaeon]